MNTVYFLVQQMMYFSIPLLIVALGALYSESSGIVNISLEGVMVIGAFSGILFINKTQHMLSGQLQLFLALLIAGVAGVIISIAHAYASIKMKANQVISGTAINMFAPAFAIYVARVMQKTQQVNFKNTFSIEQVPVLGSVPVVGPLLFQNTYITTYLGIVIFAVTFIVFYKTKFGLRLRSCGENPQAGDSLGINIFFYRYAGVLISGLLAGIGGLVYIIPTSTNFNATVSGYGYLAMAVLIFGQWKPFNILITSFFFGFMKTIASAYTVIPFLAQLKLPREVYKMIPYIITLVALAVTSKRSRAPKAVGVVYDKSIR